MKTTIVLFLTISWSGCSDPPRTTETKDTSRVDFATKSYQDVAKDGSSSQRQQGPCPAAELCVELDRHYRMALEKDSLSLRRFVDVFAQLLPMYDCKREFDYGPVPAIWLCENEDDPLQLSGYFDLLSRLETDQARSLYASPQFRAVLDGDHAEDHLNASLELERKLKRATPNRSLN